MPYKHENKRREKINEYLSARYYEDTFYRRLFVDYLVKTKDHPNGIETGQIQISKVNLRVPEKFNYYYDRLVMSGSDYSDYHFNFTLEGEWDEV